MLTEKTAQQNDIMWFAIGLIKLMYNRFPILYHHKGIMHLYLIANKLICITYDTLHGVRLSG